MLSTCEIPENKRYHAPPCYVVFATKLFQKKYVISLCYFSQTALMRDV